MSSTKHVVVKQEILFERDLPPLTASVQQTWSGEVLLAMLGVAAILSAIALYIARKAEIMI